MKRNGIICLETEWEHTSRSNKLKLHTKGLLDFISKTYNCKVIYRTIATIDELKFYLNQFSKKIYVENYNIFYFSIHGNTKSILLEGEREPLSLNDLAELIGSSDIFANKFVHFSSCRTLLDGKNNESIKIFKASTKAYCVSGYTKSVNSVRSAINDIAFFDEIFRHMTRRAEVVAAYNKLYSNLGNELGFKIV